jgi:hypothetical protein
MTACTRLSLVAIWVGSLVAVAALAGAQVQRQIIPLATPVVLSGPDVGFRVEGQAGSVPTGRLVIRVKGEWVVPTFKGGEAARAVEK